MTKTLGPYAKLIVMSLGFIAVVGTEFVSEFGEVLDPQVVWWIQGVIALCAMIAGYSTPMPGYRYPAKSTRQRAAAKKAAARKTAARKTEAKHAKPIEQPTEATSFDAHAGLVERPSDADEPR